MSEPFDLDALEVESRPPFTFTFGGTTFECIDPNRFDIRRIRDEIADADTDPSKALRFLLGDDEQYARLEAVDAVFTAHHLRALSEAWAAHYGIDVPKSGGSPRPSTVTQMR